MIFLAWSVGGAWGRSADFFEIKVYSEIHSLFVFFFFFWCGRMCYEMRKRNSSYVHPNYPPLFSLHAANTPDHYTSAGPAHRACCTRLPFLVLSIHSWVWITEVAAILYGVTIKLFLTLLYGETIGWIRRKLSAYSLLKILELSCDRIQQIVLKYKPEPELPLSSVSSSTKLSGIWDPI